MDASGSPRSQTLTTADIELLARLEPPSTRQVLRAFSASHADPVGFARALDAFAREDRGLASLRDPLTHCDLFHDMVTRHVAGGRAVFRWYDSQRWQSLSYGDLERQSGELAADWGAQGVRAGMRVCLMRELGPDLVVSLFTCLRLGAHAALLPPAGHGVVARRFAALLPDFVDIEQEGGNLPAGSRARLLERGIASDRVRGSYVSPAEEPCLLAFAPLRFAPKAPRRASADPVPVAAQVLRYAALRDGLLTYALRPGDELAAPGLSTLQYAPALLFAALSVGATYVHLSVDQVAREPQLLSALRLRSLGLCRTVRDLCAAARVPLSVEHWFRNPEEPLDWAEWISFLRQTSLAHAFASNVLVDATRGGAVLVSLRTAGAPRPVDAEPAPHASPVHAQVIPAAGVSFACGELTAPERPAKGHVGVFEQRIDGEPAAPGYLVLARARNELFVYAGTLTARRNGQVYPCEEVEACALALPDVLGACVVPVPGDGGEFGYRFVLLLFVTPHAGSVGFDERAAALALGARERIALELGLEFVPDFLEALPLRPKLTPRGALDLADCQAQYWTGAWFRKARTPAFLWLTRLHASVARAGASALSAEPQG